MYKHINNKYYIIFGCFINKRRRNNILIYIFIYMYTNTDYNYL